MDGWMEHGRACYNQAVWLREWTQHYLVAIFYPLHTLCGSLRDLELSKGEFERGAVAFQKEFSTVNPASMNASGWVFPFCENFHARV